MNSIRRRIEAIEAAHKNNAPAIDSQLANEIHRAVDAFGAGLTCPADVSPEIWQVIINLDEEC